LFNIERLQDLVFLQSRRPVLDSDVGNAKMKVGLDIIWLESDALLKSLYCLLVATGSGMAKAESKVCRGTAWLSFDGFGVGFHFFLVIPLAPISTTKVHVGFIEMTIVSYALTANFDCFVMATKPVVCFCQKMPRMAVVPVTSCVFLKDFYRLLPQAKFTICDTKMQV
jgi:hypothetical protein